MEYFVGRPAMEPYRIRRFEWIGKRQNLFNPQWEEIQGAHVFGNYLLAFLYSAIYRAHVFSLPELEMVMDDQSFALATQRSLEHRGMPVAPPPLKKADPPPLEPPPPAGKI